MKYFFTILLWGFVLSSFAQGYIPPSNGSAGTVAGGNGTPGIIAGGPRVVPGTPTIGVTPTSLTGYSTTSGTASASQNYSLSWSNLTANITVTAPSSYEVSTDNATFTSSLTVNYTSTSPVLIYVRIAASASAGSPSGNVTNASTGATTQNVAVSGTVAAATSAYFNFSGGAAPLGTIGSNVWNNVHTSSSSTNPGTISATDAATGWTVTSNGSGAWNGFGGFYGGTGNGATGSTDATFTAAVISSGNLYTYDSPFSGTYLFTITNLAAGTYTLKFNGSINTADFTDGGTMSFHVKVGTGSDQIATPSGFSANNNNGISTISITVTSGQTVQFGGFTDATGSNNLGWNNAMSITKTS